MGSTNLISIIIMTIAFVCSAFYNAFYDFSTWHETGKSINIEINQPTDLKYKTKDEIYSIRKEYVAKSIFAKNNYKPSDDVFGQIVDNKPWVGMNLCKPDSSGAVDIRGASEESRFINNPTLLVGINYPYHFGGCTKEQKQTYKYFMPREITYYKDNKVISVKYKHIPPEAKNTFYTLDALNARDLGYKYAYIDPLNTSMSFVFQDNGSISKEAYEFLNYIHLGNSCGVPGGCNNGSPNQPALNFQYMFFNDETNEDQIYIRLWKNKPRTVFQKADIVEIIHVDK